MGSDYGSHQVSCGDRPAEECRTAVSAHARRVMAEQGYREVEAEGEADRCLVMGPPGRWLHLGDTAASTEFADPEAFAALSTALSTFFPLVDIEMSDDACLHLTLYRGGRVVDRFGTGVFPCHPFESAEQEAEHRGNPAEWQALLLPRISVARLRKVWDSRRKSAWQLLPAVAALLGWHPELVRVGYTHDNEGIPEKYDAYLADSDIELVGFQELYFRLIANEADGAEPLFAGMEWD